MEQTFDDDISFAIQEAATHGSNEVISLLLSNGGVVNLGNCDNVTPLHFACLAGKVSTVSLLLEKGAMVNACNVDGSTPLCDACCNGSSACVRLLLEKGAHVNPRLCMTSPLHEAMLRDQWKCAKLLVDAGARLDVMDCHFGTPLHVAAWKKHIRSGFVLLQAGANVNSPKTLETPLHYSAKAGDIAFSQMLVDFGANVYATDNYGFLPSCHVADDHPLHVLLREYQSTPRQLRDLCRLGIRRTLGVKRLRQIPTLNLPKYLKNYLEYWEYADSLLSKTSLVDNTVVLK